MPHLNKRLVTPGWAQKNFFAPGASGPSDYKDGPNLLPLKFNLGSPCNGLD